MKIKIILACAAVSAMTCALPSQPTLGPFSAAKVLAQATDADADKGMIGSWHHATNGDRWVFSADGTYVFTGGAAKRRAGTFLHSGTWSVSNYHPSHSDAPSTATLRLRTTERVSMQNGRRRTVSGTRLLDVPLLTTEAEGQVIINRVSYWLNGVVND